MISVSTKFTNSADIEAFAEKLRSEGGPAAKSVRICIGTGCAAKGSRRLYKLFCEAVEQSGQDVKVEAKCVGCHGFCERGPIVVVEPGQIFYQQVEEPDVAEIFRETVVGGRVVERLLYEDPNTGKKAEKADEIDFYKVQERIVLGNNGLIDPTKITDYIAEGGYKALAKVLSSMTQDEVISEVEVAGLRGRGGGGFPTARKWRSCREAKGSTKYVICNGDEGDPGAFMDRSIMEGNPHSVIEGMLIGAYAIESNQGYIYVRNEYPLAVEHLRTAISQAREFGLLGKNILGSSFSFDIRINRGGGAFVCGESTALMASLEGRSGEPRAKYVHTVESGLLEKPTNLNNVETWANVPAIINKGGKSFADIGTEKSKGTKVFSLVGKVTNTGLVEVPMGITLRQIIEQIGGGVRDGKRFKAVQTGGPSGGCIPAEHLDARVDFDELTKLGSMMGSGGMIVMDEDTCMVNVAKYFTNFLKEESCGKCTPCREGLAQMLYILDRITDGEGQAGDVERLEGLAELLEGTALCALGKTAANPIISTIRYFRDEYDTHIKEKHCPAKECRGLFRYEIDSEACKACGICMKNCPVDAITGEKKVPHVIDQEKCTLCGTCWEKCPFAAVLKV
ncbi:MAG: 4Fe-4S dicluster domain-containing protein [Phycisphaerae bacterium]|nr:4Fe-4S dicluster domain-containing protein [Phycisphaerae bacterium]NIP55252.1 4Fe-4S dicluster domain-containing protein [Phycisphaerae bacterium]NIS53925.1 4Fe-4S dicluster domain-containing protein [Phycisphaerae bacterium]NIU11533.1 4Fe-4S dicluster domain-containing protein [Phycisphaerae bacterium]NIU59325.1 4Fe-4S dicluster domain-containing protein [Phycisphaerae bacterium]